MVADQIDRFLVQIHPGLCLQHGAGGQGDGVQRVARGGQPGNRLEVGVDRRKTEKKIGQAADYRRDEFFPSA